MDFEDIGGFVRLVLLFSYLIGGTGRMSSMALDQQWEDEEEEWDDDSDMNGVYPLRLLCQD